MMRFILPFPPSVNTAYVQGRNRRAKSRKVISWEENAKEAIRLQSLPVVRYRCDIHYMLYRPDNRCRDAGNYEKYTTDLLVSSGILVDDSFRWVRKITTEWHDKMGGFIEVTISSPTPRL